MLEDSSWEHTPNIYKIRCKAGISVPENIDCRPVELKQCHWSLRFGEDATCTKMGQAKIKQWLQSSNGGREDGRKAKVRFGDKIDMGIMTLLHL